MSLTIGSLLSLCLFLVSAHGEVLSSCSVDTSKGALCWVDVEKLYPTQFSVGFFEVDLKTIGLAKQIVEDNLDPYLISHPMPAVIGPGNRVYITDGHHFSRSAHKTRVQQVVVQIERNWSDLSEERFWEKMRDNGWVYLSRLGVGPLDPKDLPQTMADLVDDPYRSLAYLVRKAGGYKKSNQRYAEYAWADFLRTRVQLIDDNYGASIVRGVALARSRDASHLPGWSGGCEESLRKK